MKITLLRHTEVQEKYRYKYNGHNNIGLSKNGKAHAKIICKKLNNQTFDLVYASDLLRVRQSVKHLKKDIIYTNKLREKSWGRHEGMSFDEIINSEDFKYENFLQWINALDGERYETYINRIKIFFFEYLKSLKQENILIITHAGVIRTLLSLVKDISLEEAFKIKIDYGDLISANI